MSLLDRWSEKTLRDGEWMRFGFGELNLILLNAYEEWRIAKVDEVQSGLPQRGVLSDLSDDLEWERWDHDPKDTLVRFRPTFPDMPVVAKPRSLLNLSPKGEAAFFIGIPAWIEVTCECQGAILELTEFPSEELSKTWHGNNLEGLLGYALKTFARRVFDTEVLLEHEVVCPINVINEGDEMLPFDRLYLETDHLSVFEKDGRLWSNAAKVHAGDGENNMSNITYEKKPASPNDDADELTPPRKGYVRRSSMESALDKVFSNFNPLAET